MKIVEHAKGFTVVDNSGNIRLLEEGGQAGYCATKAEVLAQCNARGLYEGKDGTLLELILE